tara:strand:- start:143 stop:313 length:171 start_codon:yes stop_codon:yes gene_type:complete
MKKIKSLSKIHCQQNATDDERNNLNKGVMKRLLEKYKLNEDLAILKDMRNSQCQKK